MPISKASSSAVAPGAKGDLVVGTTTNDSGILAVGSANQVLTVDSSTATGLKWAAPAAGGASWTEIGTVSPTGTTTASFTSLSGYNQYLIIIEGLSPSSTSGSTFAVRFNNDSANNYYGQGWLRSNASTDLGAYNISDTSFQLAPVGDLASAVMRGYMFVSGANATGPKVVHFAATGTGVGAQVRSAAGRYVGTSTISRIDVISNADNFDAGTVRLLGSTI